MRCDLKSGVTYLRIQDSNGPDVEEAALEVASFPMHACALQQRVDVVGVQRNRGVQVCKRCSKVAPFLVQFCTPAKNDGLNEAQVSMRAGSAGT